MKTTFTLIVMLTLSMSANANGAEAKKKSKPLPAIFLLTKSHALTALELSCSTDRESAITSIDEFRKVNSKLVAELKRLRDVKLSEEKKLKDSGNSAEALIVGLQSCAFDALIGHIHLQTAAVSQTANSIRKDGWVANRYKMRIHLNDAIEFVKSVIEGKRNGTIR